MPLFKQSAIFHPDFTTVPKNILVGQDASTDILNIVKACYNWPSLEVHNVLKNLSCLASSN